MGQGPGLEGVGSRKFGGPPPSVLHDKEKDGKSCSADVIS